MMTLLELLSLIPTDKKPAMEIRNKENATLMNRFESQVFQLCKEYLYCEVMEFYVFENGLVIKVDDRLPRYHLITEKWEEMSKALDRNDIDRSNELLIQIEELLPFASEEEHKRWSDISDTYMDFEAFEDATVEIAKRLLWR